MSSIAVPRDNAAVEEALAPRTAVLAPAPPNVFVIPVYNEEENVGRLLEELEQHPWLFAEETSRLILVDDGSTDATPELLAAYAGPLPLCVVTLDPNQGPGAAFRAGFARALAEAPPDALVVTLEADTTSDLEALPALIARAREGADLVLASVHAGGQMVNVSALRRVLSRGAGWVVRRALGLDARTVSSFFRVYRSSVLREASSAYGDSLIEERGFACMAEVLAKLTALGAAVVEVPVDLDGSRRVGASKMTLLPTLCGYGRLLVRGTAPAQRIAS